MSNFSEVNITPEEKISEIKELKYNDIVKFQSHEGLSFVRIVDVFILDDECNCISVNGHFNDLCAVCDLVIPTSSIIEIIPFDSKE